MTVGDARGMTAGDRAALLDLGAVTAISALICCTADRPLWMTVAVPSLIAARLALWARLPRGERGGGLGSELLLFAICTVVGAFNDWNTVVRHAVYDYRVPHLLPVDRAIPVWMLLYWGLALRTLVTLFRWRRLAPPERPRDEVYLPGRVVRSPRIKVGLQLALVLATRQLIYRWYGDPLLSWLPFAAALAIYVALFRLDRHERRVVACVAIGGPAIEVFYIQLGDLHAYRLGWIGGVPLWIALWWVLAALLWNDLSLRLQRTLASGRYQLGRRRCCRWGRQLTTPGSDARFVPPRHLGRAPAARSGPHHALRRTEDRLRDGRPVPRCNHRRSPPDSPGRGKTFII